MRIGELARRADLSRDTIRFYEKKGLIRSVPSAGASNDYRDYSEETLFTLELITEAQAAGFTIADLRTFFRQLENAHEEDFEGEVFLQQKIEDVEETIRRSRRFLKTLKEAKAALVSASDQD
ncbi:MerR family transcriptional regulator [uncultured Roseibium sp.]|uniref:MerR family transcriptional regulator n=1 Tax=uncultured Roseibium sp. TaxID=1936171 RepID=UPI00262F178C|nr:MerR family transcriptional regulator [uncultured Roseibium sp.]